MADHARAPVLEAIAAFRDSGATVYGPPGHKQGAGIDPRVQALLGEGAFLTDVLMLNGLDDRRLSGDVLTDAEALLADAVHAENAFFSTCGSSLSVKAAMLAVAGPGEELVVARNCHKSVVAGLVLSGIQPVWVRPEWDDELQVAQPPTARAVDQALAAHPSAKGALIVSPTDYGTCAQLRDTAAACHRRGVPLIVDEAWACHFPFHDDLPTWAMDAGADLCVTSVHKSGSGLEQSSCFHTQGELVDVAVLAARADLLSTTSPSALMYAAIDGWRRQMVEHGSQLLGRAQQVANDFGAAAGNIPGIDLALDAWTRGPGAATRDPLKFCLDVWRLGLSGYDAAGWLRAHEHVNVAMADHRRVVLMFTHADDQASAERAVQSLRQLSSAHAPADQPRQIVHIPSPGALDAELAQPPRDAFFAPIDQVKLGDAPGRVCAEIVSPYPPGIPVLAPGEVVGSAHVEYLASGMAHGMYVPDAADPSLETLRVVAG